MLGIAFFSARREAGQDQVHAEARKVVVETLCPFCYGRRGRTLLTAPDRFHGRSDGYRLLRCDECSCVWLPEPPPPEAMPFHYGRDYHRLIAASGEDSADKRWRRPRREISKHKPHGAILDIGCNTGGFLGTMRDWTRYGIELDPEAAAEARRKVGCEVYAGDAMTAPFGAESFDVVTCFDVLEHVYDPLKLLRAIHRWLKPGGILYVCVPNIASWESRLFRSYWYGLELPRHLFHFSPASLRYLTRSVDLREVRLTTHSCYAEPSVGYLYDRLRCMAGSAPSAAAFRKPPGLPWKCARKALRLAFVNPLAGLAVLAGAGAGIEGIFFKGNR